MPPPKYCRSVVVVAVVAVVSSPKSIPFVAIKRLQYLRSSYSSIHNAYAKYVTGGVFNPYWHAPPVVHLPLNWTDAARSPHAPRTAKELAGVRRYGPGLSWKLCRAAQTSRRRKKGLNSSRDPGSELRIIENDGKHNKWEKQESRRHVKIQEIRAHLLFQQYKPEQYQWCTKAYVHHHYLFAACTSYGQSASKHVFAWSRAGISRNLPWSPNEPVLHEIHMRSCTGHIAVYQCTAGGVEPRTI